MPKETYRKACPCGLPHSVLRELRNAGNDILMRATKMCAQGHTLCCVRRAFLQTIFSGDFKAGDAR